MFPAVAPPPGGVDVSPLSTDVPLGAHSVERFGRAKRREIDDEPEKKFPIP